MLIEASIIIYSTNWEEGMILNEKLIWQCPCGFALEAFRGINDAITLVQVHIETSHKDYLPFGITRNEILALLRKARKVRVKRKTKSSDNTVLLN